MASSTPLQFNIPDMAGDDCIAAIEKAVRAIDPDARVVGDIETKRVVIGSTADAGDVAQAIDAAGFTVKAAD